MRVIKILLVIQILAVLFLMIPYSIGSPNYVSPFVFNESLQLPLRSYVWLLGNRIGLCLFYYCIYHLIGDKYKGYAFLFICMEVFLVVEYLLSYNRTWFELPMLGMIGLSHFFIIFKGLIIAHASWEQYK